MHPCFTTLILYRRQIQIVDEIIKIIISIHALRSKIKILLILSKNIIDIRIGETL